MERPLIYKAGQHVCSILGIEAFGNLDNQDQITKLKPFLCVNPDFHSPRVRHEYTYEIIGPGGHLWERFSVVLLSYHANMLLLHEIIFFKNDAILHADCFLRF